MNTPPENSNILALIPARAGSKGIPNKNTRPLHGLPLIGYAIRAALASKTITRTIVTTDSDDIAQLAQTLGAETPFIRPASVATDTTPMLEAITHALDWLDANESYTPDIVILLQPTAPLRTEHHIDDALTQLLNSAADAIVSVTQIPTHHNAHWQLAFDGDHLTLADGNPLANIITRRQNLPPTYTRNGAIYAFRTQAFRKINSFYGDTCLGYIMPPHESINIDTPDDWRLAEQALRSHLDENSQS